MHLCYMDDSGDLNIRVFSLLCIPEDQWKASLDQIHEYRRNLKKKEGIFVTVELHATEFVSGRGKISPHAIPKGARCRIYKEVLAEITKLPDVRLFNAVGPRLQEARLFERLLNRINRTMVTWSSHSLIVSDQGKDYTRLLRKMRVHNPIPSRYGIWPTGALTKNITLDRIVEDLFMKNSKRSYFIQLADFCAYALLRCEVPIPSKTKYGLDKAFNILSPVCVTQCFSADPKKLGIVRV